MMFFELPEEREKNTKEVNEMLHQLVRVLNKPTASSRWLWNVLTALRGPDKSNTGYEKNLTTARLRGALGLNGHVGFEISHSELITRLESELPDQTVGAHFRMHHNDAVNSLRYLGFEKEETHE